MKEVVPQDEITLMVRQVLGGQDLSKITGKMVRERIIQQLGDRIKSEDLSAIKAAVKSALKTVLQQSSNAVKSETPAPPLLPPAQDTAHQPPPEHKNDPVHPLPKTKQPMNQLDEENSQPHKPDSDSDYDHDHQPQVKPPSKKRMRKVVTSDSELNSDSEPKPQPRRKKNATTSIQKNPRHQPTSAGQRRLVQLKNLCRQLGCPVPPAKQRGADLSEKCANVINHLQSKGLRMEDPLSMSSHEISRHRIRIAREKELEGLDVKNIIEEGGRSRRRVSKPIRQLNDKLPSDLSGAELSEDSESAESEGYAAPSEGSE